jgi:hypothetical protein
LGPGMALGLGPGPELAPATESPAEPEFELG